MKKAGKGPVEGVLLHHRILVGHELQVLVEDGLALAALRQEVEADAADVVAGMEVGGAVDGVAEELELHQAPAVQTDAVALA